MLTNDYKLKFTDWQNTLKEKEPVFFGTKHRYIGEDNDSSRETTDIQRSVSEKF